jgi:predicted nucleotide-binding protein (sugar kinase/HSP70/actin superfamily)
MIIGIPRALLFFRYHVLWNEFFTQLGCKVVLSPVTNRQILADGVNLAIDENCLPVKLLLGHIKALKDKADFIFIPRLVTLSKKEESCNKYMGLYDIATNIFPTTRFIEYSISERDNETEFMAFFTLGLKLNKNPLTVYRAYTGAKKAFEMHKKEEIAKQEEALQNTRGDLKILLVSHPYVIYDKFVGDPIIKFLEKEKVHLIHSDIIEATIAKERAKKISPDLYWTDNKEYVGAIDYYKKRVDGIIYLMAFPCGPDALVIDLCKKKFKDTPSIILVLDELAGEIGLITRLESFVDILRFKKRKRAKKS